MLHPDLYVLTNDEHWTMTPETHKYAAAAGSFCFVTTENGDQQNMCNLTTMPCVQRSLYLNELTNDFEKIKAEVPDEVDGHSRDMLELCITTCGRAAGTRAKMRSRARKEASAQEVRGYYKQFAEAKHLEYRSWVDNKVFDLIEMRKVKPRNFVTGRWVLTIKTDKQGNFLKATARWVLRGFQDKQKEYQQTDSPASTRPGFRMGCQMAATEGCDLLQNDLKTAFLQGQSYGVNRYVVCQFPPEASHPLYTAARLKKPACGTNDASRRWWNIFDKALCSYGMIPTRTDLCSIQSRERTWNQNNSKQWHDTSDILNKPRVRTEADAPFEKNAGSHCKKSSYRKSVAEIKNLFVDDLFETGGTEIKQRVLARLGKDFHVHSQDWNEVLFTGQRIRWTKDPQSRSCVEVSQGRLLRNWRRFH